MKLTKISLATLVALGAFSSVASATPLEEAIKNVDLSGFARYRYTTTKKEPAGEPATTKATHQFKSIFSFKAALDDNFFGVLSLRYNKNDGSGNTEGQAADPTKYILATDNGDYTNTTSAFGVNEFYLGYTVGNTTVTAGKQVLGTYFTDDAIGTGIRVVNNDIKGLTLAAVAFDAIEDNADEMDGKLFEDLKEAFGNNLYGLAAIGSFDPVSFQLWYASLVDVVDLIAADVAFNFDVTNDVSLGLQAQFVNSSVEKDITAVKDTNFYAVEASTELFGADLSAGYIGWKVKDSDGRGIVSLEDQGSLIDVGEIKTGRDYTYVANKANFWFAKAGYKFAEKFGVGAEYANGKVSSPLSKNKYQEYVARLSYDYSAKLKFSGFYAYEVEKDVVASDKDKRNMVRFEAKYSF